MRFEEYDWQSHVPLEKAVLVFVVNQGSMLLGFKKRGLGSGNFNGYGGRIEQGEKPEEAARREFREETGGAELVDLDRVGLLDFAFVDGFSMRVFVFVSTEIRGVVKETDEMVPFWKDKNDIPYSHMWADDRVWFPKMLKGEKFEGRFLLDDGMVLGCSVWNV